MLVAVETHRLQDLVPTQSPSLIPTPSPTPTPEPEPSATPVRVEVRDPVLTSTEAENLVFQHVRSCSDQIVGDDRSEPILIVFLTDYFPETEVWEVFVASDDKILSFGVWGVIDSDSTVSAIDPIAADINQPDTQCVAPVTQFDRQYTPPKTVPSPPDAPANPDILIGTGALASLIVWSNVYSCYDHFPELLSFTSNQDENGNWIVEGRSAAIEEENSARKAVFFYGLWRVNAVSGEIVARDAQANRAAFACAQQNSGSTELTADLIPLNVASLQVWTAVYDCFNPRPEFSSFTMRRESTARHIVEGRFDNTVVTVGEIIVSGTPTPTETTTTETVFYGLWFVDPDSFEITPWDSLAKSTAAKSCYQLPIS